MSFSYYYKKKLCLRLQTHCIIEAEDTYMPKVRLISMYNCISEYGAVEKEEQWDVNV